MHKPLLARLDALAYEDALARLLFILGADALWLGCDDVIGLVPYARFTLVGSDGASVLHIQEAGQRIVLPSSYAHLCQTLTDYSQVHVSTHRAKTCTYVHGFMGYIGYDVAAAALTKEAVRDGVLAHFVHFALYLRYADDAWHLIQTDGGKNEYEAALEVLKRTLSTPPVIPRGRALTPVWQKSDYENAFAKTQAYLKAGDGYQINLTQAFTSDEGAPVLGFLPRLWRATHAPYACYLKTENLEVLSASPELFLQFEHAQGGAIAFTAKPIKGTRPRGLDPLSDAQYKADLIASEKDIAENLMIVDLLRNDLGRYAKTGSVHVPKRFAIESFSNVHHMVSTITATKKDDTSSLLVLFDSLPAGSITGAPKKRSCELIWELEGVPRGAYCGSMGFMNFDGTGVWNVLIRTLSVVNGKTHLNAGGGITVLSDVKEEYQECLDKIDHIRNLLHLVKTPHC